MRGLIEKIRHYGTNGGGRCPPRPRGHAKPRTPRPSKPRAENLLSDGEGVVMPHMHSESPRGRFAALGPIKSRLTPIRDLGHGGLTLYRCECGNKTTARRTEVRRGVKKSCGCLNAELRARVTTHGMTQDGERPSEYTIWQGIVARCTNRDDPEWVRYGGRGITICSEWRQDPGRFLSDMGPKPSPSHSIDRIDNSRGYEPGNCRWATKVEQATNRRDNVFVTYQGERVCVSELADRLGIKRNTIYMRLARGMSPEDAFAIPIKKCTRRTPATTGS